MSVTQQTPYGRSVGNGVTAQFFFQYKILAAGDLEVLVNGVTKTLGVDYTVAGVGVDAGGSFTMLTGAPVIAADVFHRRKMRRERLTDYQQAGDFLTPTVNPDFDRAILMLQELDRAIQRTLRLTSYDNIPDASLELSPLANWKGKFLRLNAITGAPEPADFTGAGVVLSSSILGPFLNPQTAAEALAGVVPTAFAYPVLNPFRYGADGTGGAADATAITRVNAVIAQIAAGLNPWSNGASVGAYPATAVEIATAGVGVFMIKNPTYPPMHVKRYGAVGDGVVNDGPAWQAAINVARAIGGFVTWDAPSNFYSITQALDCSTTGQPAIKGFGFRSNGGTAYDAPPTIIFKHAGHAFDCTGTSHIIFSDMNIGTDAATYPKTCFFLARNIFNQPNNGSAGWHRFNNVRIQGKFSGGILYNYGSEDDVFIGCDWTNFAADAGAKVGVWTSNNRLGYTSTFQTIATGGKSTIDHQIFGGQFHMQSHSAQTDVFHIDGIDSLKIYGPWMYAGDGGGGGRSLIYADGTNGASNYILLNGITGENAGANTHANGILFSNDAVTYVGWRIESCKLTSGTLAMNSPVGPSFTGFKVSQILEVVSRGVTLQGAMSNSTFDTDSTLLNFPSIPNTILIGDSSRWTLGTKDGGYLIDTGTTGRSWTPAFGTVAHGGVLTVNEQHCLIEGNKVTVTCTISDSVSITATLGQTITGLPLTSKYRSAMVLVANQTTGAAIGAGFIDATSSVIKMPAFTVGAGVAITITAVYFFAS